MKKLLTLISVAALLAGCATEKFDNVATKVDKKKDETTKVMQEKAAPARTAVAFHDGSYLPLRKVDRPQYTGAQQQLLDTEVEINRDFTNLNEVSAWLTSVSGAPISLAPELSAPLPTTSGVGGAMGGAVSGPAPIIPAATGLGAGQNMLRTIAGRPFSVTYSGRVQGLLDLVATNYGIFWKMEGASVRMFLTDTRTYRIKALPGDSQLLSTVGLMSSSGSGGSSGSSTSTQTGSSQNTTGVSFSSLSIWTGIESAVRQMLTPITGRVSVTPSTGTITVTDTPRVLDAVADYVRDQNASLTRQVAVRVRVLSVQVSDGDNYGINWQAVYNNLNDNVKVGVQTGFQAASGAASFVLQTSNPSANYWQASSGAIITALSTQGKVSELTSAEVVTLNMQPAPVNVGRQISYLASSSTTQTANVGATTTLQPGVVQTGFSMVIVPHILDGKEMMLHASVNLSSLLQLTTISAGGSSIQSPDLATSNFIQHVRMNSGNTLVIAGFDQDQLSAVANGVGSATNPVAGVRDSSGKRNLLVIILQPTVAG